MLRTSNRHCSLGKKRALVNKQFQKQLNSSCNIMISVEFARSPTRQRHFLLQGFFLPGKSYSGHGYKNSSE